MNLGQDQQEQLLKALLKKNENALCADCNAKSPGCTFLYTFVGASLDFGVFVCMNCSGAHRALGQSVTRVKSTTLDTWNRDWLWHMQVGNTNINQYYEHSLSSMIDRYLHSNKIGSLLLIVPSMKLKGLFRISMLENCMLKGIMTIQSLT